MHDNYLLRTGGEGAGREEAGSAPPPLQFQTPAASSSELADALRHVQRRQHLLEDGALHVGATQVRLLQVAAGKVTVLPGQTRTRARP